MTPPPPGAAGRGPASPEAAAPAAPADPADPLAADVRAAGAVPCRVGPAGRWQVLLVHRPRYDDWTFPKGKVDPGEHLLAAAVREVEEEAQLRVRLGVPLPGTRYRLAGGGSKRVSYWIGWPVPPAADHPAGAGPAEPCQPAPAPFAPTAEVDAVDWLDLSAAGERLSYAYDGRVLAATAAALAGNTAAGAADGAGPRGAGTHALLLVRHAAAVARAGWAAPDGDRPLSPTGRAAAADLVGPLAAYAPRRLVSSPARRCTETVAPLAAALRRPVEVEPRLAEGTHAAAVAAAGAALRDGVRAGHDTLVCAHRTTLPAAAAELGVDVAELEPGAFAVVHLRAGRVVATETHRL